MKTELPVSLLALMFLFKVAVGFAQSDIPSSATSPFITYKHGFVALGGAHGVHPNFIPDIHTTQAFFIESDHQILIKGVAFQTGFRISNEPWRSGSPTYFKFRYLPPNLPEKSLGNVFNQLKDLRKQKISCKDSIDALEAHISYMELMRFEQNKFKMDSLRELGGGVPSLSDSLPFQLPDSLLSKYLPSYSLSKADSLKLPNIHFSDSLMDFNQLELKKQQLDALRKRSLQLDSNELNLNNKLEGLMKGNRTTFLSGIKLFTVGLGSLSGGNLSKNRLPMQGVHLAGTYKKTYYDLAAGVTLKNQLFTNQAFEQLLTNTGNLFNQADFFAVNDTRFVSSAIVGYGEKDKRSIGVETFYTGRTLDEIRKKTSGGSRRLAQNITGAFTPKKFDRLTFLGSVGYSVVDTSRKITEEHLAYKGELRYRFKNTATMSYQYRKLGMEYDGWSQGINQRGAIHQEMTGKFPVANRLVIQPRLARDEFRTNGAGTMITDQATLGIQQKITRQTVIYSNYTLLSLKQGQAPKTLNHLVRAGITNTQKFKTSKLLSTVNYNFADVRTKDSTVKMIQVQGTSRITFAKFFGEMGIQLSDYRGISRIGGRNVTFQPGMGITFNQFAIDLKYSYSVSDQFGKTSGMVGHALVKFDDLFEMHFLLQKWLPIDYIFFMQSLPSYIEPLYMQWKLVINLKPHK